MALRTAFLKLIKPDYNDAADIADINANMDAIDAKAQELDESGGKALKEHDANPSAHEAAISVGIKAHDESDTAHEKKFGLFQKIKDFGESLLKTLALTTTITAIKALETNSWFGQLLKMVLTASGVKYNIAQNGYVCLGSFFGGLIIQWGIFQIINGSGSFTLPLSSTILNGHIQHCGVSAQYNGLDVTRVVSSLNESETLFFLVICK